MSAKLFGNEELLTSEHAVVFRLIPDISAMDYIRAVATVIGSNQIHSVYNNAEVCKVYLKEKKLVRTIIDSGVLLKDCLVMGYYNVPPGTKVSLLNVDPVLPSWSLECVLSFYGTLESSIMRQKLCGEIGFSHIESSTRVVYMKMFNDKKLPNKLPLFHADTLYEIDLLVEESEKT